MVTLTGTFTRLDGSPASGTVRVTPSRSPIMDPDGKIVISGPQTFPLDADGTLSVQIPASNDPDLGPAFTYAIDVNLTHANWKISKVWIPYGSTTVDLSEIGDYTPTPGVATRVVTIPADGTDGQVLVWDGAGFAWDFPPEGPEGPPGTSDIVVDTTAGTRVSANGTIIHYHSGWRALCRWTGGTVTEGTLPTGLAPRGTTAGGIYVLRTLDTITVIVVEADVTAANPQISLPAGFRGMASPYPATPIFYRDANLNPQIANAEWGANFVRYRGVPAGATLSAMGTGGYGVVATAPAHPTLPTTLPGTPA